MTLRIGCACEEHVTALIIFGNCFFQGFLTINYEVMNCLIYFDDISPPGSIKLMRYMVNFAMTQPWTWGPIQLKKKSRKSS